MTRKRGLGRGLDALLGVPETAGGEETVRQLPVDAIHRSRYQPRLDIREEQLEELAESIRAQGVMQPILVRALGRDEYELIAGERRWRAAQRAGLRTVPALVREAPEEALLAMALIENVQREGLNPLEEALALKRLVDEFGLTHQQTADAVGRSRAAVSNLLRVLDAAEPVREHLRAGRLEMGHARALLTLDPAEQIALAERVVAEGLSVRATERLVQQRLQAAPAPKKPPLDPNVRRLQDNLSERLGARVRITHTRQGRGQVVIGYNSLDELEGLLDRFKTS